MSKKILVIIILIISIALIVWGFQNGKNAEVSPSDNLVFCTQEVKQCSDGSFVSRTGPNCEFSSCPAETI